MKKIVSFIFCILIILTSCSFNKNITKETCHTFNENIHYYPFLNKNLIYIRLETINKNIITGSKAKRNQIIGFQKRKPINISKFNNYLVKEANELYDKRRFKKAANIYSKLLSKEKNNIFLIEKLARTLFWSNNITEKNRSFMLYKKLIQILENGYDSLNTDENSIIIDPWFSEANWKLGCLYLDREQYVIAIYRITIAIASGLIRYNKAYEQALSYLTKAYYFQGNYSFAKYFYYQTKKLNPNNQYVEKFDIFNFSTY